MNRDTLKKLFPNASDSFLALHLDGQTSSPFVERGFRDGPKTPMRKPRKDIGAKRPRHKQTCQQCGKEFFAANSHKRKFCSPVCAYANPQRSAHIVPKERGNATCRNCGTTFKLTRTRGLGHFCCQKCAASSTGQATVEKIRKNLFTPPSRGKSGWLEIGGKRFYARSTWEGNYARYLQFQKEHGLIFDWEHEPKTFWFEAIKRGTRSYLPDFLVTLNNKGEEYHEVKGWMDARSLTKIKRMGIYHPTVKLMVIDSEKYKLLAKQVGKIIPGWTTGKGAPVPN